MVTLVKHEWHQVDTQYSTNIDEDLLSRIYPDMDESQIANILEQIQNGEFDIEEMIELAGENDVDLEWEHQYDDWWTERKGGYEVTYELGDKNE